MSSKPFYILSFKDFAEDVLKGHYSPLVVKVYHKDGTPVEIKDNENGVPIFDIDDIIKHGDTQIYLVTSPAKAFAVDDMRKIYIAGPISNSPDYKKHFDDAERILHALGYFTVNPTSIVPSDWPQDMAMRLCIPMIEMSDGVLFLDGWENSKGTLVEKTYAEYIRKPLFFSVNELLRGL